MKLWAARTTENTNGPSEAGSSNWKGKARADVDKRYRPYSKGYRGLVNWDRLTDDFMKMKV